MCRDLRRTPLVVHLLRVLAAAGQLSVVGIEGAKQHCGECNQQEVKVYGGCGPHEVNVLRVPPTGCESTAGVTRSKIRLVWVEPTGNTFFLRGALEPHARCPPATVPSPPLAFTDCSSRRCLSPTAGSVGRRPSLQKTLENPYVKTLAFHKYDIGKSPYKNIGNTKYKILKNPHVKH